MVISLLGPSGVRCQVADFNLDVDPPANRKANLVLKTSTSLSELTAISEDNEILGAGEYDAEDIKIKGVNLQKEASKDEVKTAYSALFDDIRLAFIPEISETIDEANLDKLGEVDILFINTDSKLGAKGLNSLIKKIDPSIVIPIGDKGVKGFFEEIGQKPKAEEKLTLKAKEIGEEGTKFVWLKS